MTDRCEILNLQNNARKSGRICNLIFDKEGRIESVFDNGLITSPLAFAELERARPKWYETLQERWEKRNRN
jgi:hypothetical protein